MNKFTVLLAAIAAFVSYPASAGEKPSLYECSDARMHVYLVIAPTGEFMLFDKNGVWVNNGTFFQAKSDKNVDYLHAEIGESLLGFVMKGDKWHLAVVTPKDTHDLTCI